MPRKKVPAVITEPKAPPTSFLPHPIPHREPFSFSDAWEHPGEPGLRVPGTTRLTNLLALAAHLASDDGVRRFLNAALQLQHDIEKQHNTANEKSTEAPRRDES